MNILSKLISKQVWAKFILELLRYLNKVPIFLQIYFSILIVYNFEHFHKDNVNLALPAETPTIAQLHN